MSLLKNELLKTHCRLCANLKLPSELLDLQGDLETLEFFKGAIRCLKIDYLDLSPFNKLPKTTCEKCYDTFREACNFLKRLNQSQSGSKCLGNIRVKKEPTELNKSGNDDIHEQEIPLRIPDLEMTDESTNLEPNTDPLINTQEGTNTTIYSKCNFCAKDTKDLLDLSETKLLIEFTKITEFLKINNQNQSSTCQQCYDTLKKIYIFFQSVKQNQASLNKFVIKKEPEHSMLSVKIELTLEHDDTYPEGDETQNSTSETIDISLLTNPNLNFTSWDDYKFVCVHCHSVWNSFEELRSHSKDIHSICCALKCADCQQQFGGFHEFVEHVRLHRNILRFFCEFCNTKFNTVKECTDHVSEHYRSTQKICKLCGEMLPYENTLLWHQKMYGQSSLIEESRRSGTSWVDYEWICLECSIRLPTVDQIRYHTQRVHDKCFAIKCADCSKVAKNYKLFVAHVVIHRPYLRNYCQYCNNHYEDINDLNKHIIKHITSQQRPCNVCGMIFQNNSQLALHKREFDANGLRKMLPVSSPPPVRRRKPRNTNKKPLSTEDLTCNVCFKLCGSPLQFRRHVKTHDETRPRDYVCKICGRAFLLMYTLKEHVKTHSVKTVVCEICQRQFHTNHQLKQHIITHSEHRPFVCDECGSSFKTKTRLKYHLKSHSAVKDFKCMYCDKEFSFKMNLKTHERQHTGQRPYACEMCEKTFTNWTNCNKHMIRKHGVTLARTKITAQGRVKIDRTTGEPQCLASDEKAKEWLDSMMKPEKRGKKAN